MRIKNIIAIGVLIEALLKMTAHAEEHAVPATAKVSARYQSDYVLHGLLFSTKPVVQTTISGNWKHFTGTIFTNVDEDMQPGEINEFDWNIDYTKQLGKATVSAGYTRLIFHHTNFPSTNEAYAGISLDAILEPSVSIVHIFGGENGTTTELSVGTFIGKEGKGIDKGIDVRGVLNHNEEYWREGSGLGNAELRISTRFRIGKRLIITPQLNYSIALDDNFYDGLYGGVSVLCSSYRINATLK